MRALIGTLSCQYPIECHARTSIVNPIPLGGCLHLRGVGWGGGGPVEWDFSDYWKACLIFSEKGEFLYLQKKR